tara:strand:- start:3009 stop:3287 length:279 start_codon:yes stop_codon:yes gene_type:complete
MTLEKEIKIAFNFQNYRREVFSCDWIDHPESSGEYFVCFNTGNKEHDLATLKRIQEYLKPQTKEVVYLVASTDEDHWGRKTYDGSVLFVRLK